VVCEQLGPVTGNHWQAISVSEAKMKHQRQGLFLYAYANMHNMYEVETIIYRICNNENENAEYGT
jgi:hypothetical protein